jgi:CDP-paratose 2-epimerase
MLSRKVVVSRADWRPGDQKVFVADIRKAAEELFWKPHLRVEEGVGRLFAWVSENRKLF